MAYIGKVTAGGNTGMLVGSTLYGTCETAAATAAKVAVITGFDTLETGVTVHIKFTNSNTVANPTLAIKATSSGTATTAKSIMRYGTTAPSTTAKTSWQAGSVISFTYDGTYWQMNGWLNDDSTYTVNNGTLTIQKNGTSVATFTANQSGNSTANITGTFTDENVKQTAISSETGTYRLLMSASADDTTHTEGARKSGYGLFNANAKSFTFGSRKSGSTEGANSLVEGANNVASANYAHAEGNNTSATSDQAHAEGVDTCASGWASHAEGNTTRATNNNTHAEGYMTSATAYCAHAEGWQTSAGGEHAHAEGENAKANGNNTHAEGYGTSAGPYNYAHAEGCETVASGGASHAEGLGARATNNQAHAEGYYTSSTGAYSHTEGGYTSASGNGAHAEGGYSTSATATKRGTKATGENSHAEGLTTLASSATAHAEGESTSAVASWTHAEGVGTCASQQAAHAEGNGTRASGYAAHAEGNGTRATGYSACHAEGAYTCATGSYSHTEGYYTIANHRSQHVFGEYNIADPSSEASTVRGNYIEVVGNGTSSNARSNARTLDWNGNETLAGQLQMVKEVVIVANSKGVNVMNANKTKSLSFNVSSGNNGGLYDNNAAEWMIVADSSNTVHIKSKSGHIDMDTSTRFTNGHQIEFWADSGEGTGDIVYWYYNTKEKARIWCDGNFTSFAGPYYRCYNNPSSGSQTTWSGRLAVTSSSDIRLKENVKDTEVDRALDVINQIKIRSFDWKNTDKHQKIGFVADELEEIDPSFVDEGSGGYNKFGDINPKSVNNFYMLGYIVKAMQEMSEQIEDLKAQNAKLEKEIKALKKK